MAGALAESAEPRAVVRGDPAAVQATVDHLIALAAGCAATAHGLDAVATGTWTGAAAEAFDGRFAEVPDRWTRAAAAFRSAAQAWERFGIELVAAQEQAAAASAGGDATVVPGLLAEARARRDRAADLAAREIAAAAASAPEPPAGGDRRLAEATDWVRAQGIQLGHIGEGIGEGVEDVVRLARIANPADPYNLNHSGRFVANASTALSGAMDDVVHPLRQIAGVVGHGWGSDPARAFGHLLPTVLLAGAGRAVASARRPVPLLADPRPTAAPFEPPVGSAASAVGEADRIAAKALMGIERRHPTRHADLMPKEVAEPGPHHDAQRARRARVTRADQDFTRERASRGNRKSHLDEHGRLVPANPEGAASVVEHVTGRRAPAKGDSPYSSFTAPGVRAAVDFGGSVIEVDVVRLQADIDAGRVPGVDILPPHRVQAAIQADADRIAGRPVDLYVRKGHIPEAARSYGLDAEATAALRQRMIDMANAQRHHEWMIRGIVPSRYIVGPHPRRSRG
jgi:type VII secretion system ESX-1 substrate